MSEMRFSGSGGQGVITCAIILAQAAVEEGKNAIQSQAYGPAARGGSSKAEVIISNEAIYHPHVEAPDFILAMTQEAADKYWQDLKSDGILLLDERLVPNPPAFAHTIRIPITHIAMSKIGKALFANIVALGAAVRITGAVGYETVAACVAHRVPPATVESNMKALKAGYDAADELMK